MENRQPFNYHTHTYRCGHAVICPDEEYVKAAIEGGFKILGFSDHAPYKELNKKSDRMDYDELDGYFQSVRSLKEKYKEQIDIKIGLETEFFPEHFDQIKELATKTDYLILGQHYPNVLGEKDYSRHCGSKEEIKLYGKLIETALHNHKFLYLAHPDYFCGSIYEFDETCQEVAHQICAAAVETNTPLEVNIKLSRRKPRQYSDGMHIMYPFPAFWQIASQYPVKCIYGFDAHNPIDLTNMDLYRQSDEILEGIKLDFIKEPLF